MNKINKVKYFKERVNYYFFGVFKLVDFNLSIYEQIEAGVMASTYWHPIESGSGMISICYSKDWIESRELNKESIDIVAFHEVLEALLSEMQELAISRFISKKDIPNAVHRVIRRMENIVYPLVK